MSIFFICSIAPIALRPVGGRVGKQIDQHRGHDLPGHSVPILQPVALLCLGVAAFGQVVPVVVHFGLGPAFDDNRDCLVELEDRAAVQRLGVRPVELKRDRQCRAFRLAGGLSTFLVVAQGGAPIFEAANLMPTANRSRCRCRRGKSSIRISTCRSATTAAKVRAHRSTIQPR